MQRNFKPRRYRLNIQEKGQFNRIKDAVKLIEDGAVTPYKDGKFWVRTERMSIAYTVSPTSCTCVDFILHQHPCKHMWAAIGGTVVFLIRDILAAKTMDELKGSYKPYADELAALPEAFLTIARSLYATRRDELTARTALAGILVKPQPPSNGRVNGFEL